VPAPLVVFEVEEKRGGNLENCYQNFNSIPVSSVEPERVFSRFGRTVIKIRSSLQSVDMLTFLKGYFKTENN
jgi:hypothetical protein